MIISLDNWNSDGLGPKTLNLKKLKDMGFNVPIFCAIPAGTEVEIAEITAAVPASSYAVRSSALIEDSATDSMAGQFQTKVDVLPADLLAAIESVIADAKTKLSDDLSKFSVIVQEYIPAEISGVTFTRNPLGGREMVIEHHQGKGEELVSGQIKPQRITSFWNQPAGGNLETVITQARDIETKYGSPQDIEWLISKGELFIVQTRPITTISAEGYKSSLYLDKVLPGTPFVYEKTEISEIAPRPTNLVLEILKQIYAVNGPVKKVYSKFGISYTDTDFIRVVGNELYIDREQELHSLLPSHTVLKTGAPTWDSFTGILTTIKNSVNLNRIKVGQKQLLQELKTALGSNTSQPAQQPSSINVLIHNFLTDYQLIFETNLVAAKALQSLSAFASKEKISVADLLNANVDLSEFKIDLDSSAWLGNSLDIADEAQFYAASEMQSGEEVNSKHLISALPKIKQIYAEKLITDAKIYSRLREYGRWLTVKHVNLIRQALLEKFKSWSEPRLSYFATTSELDTISETELRSRQQAFQQLSVMNLPARLTNLSEAMEAGKLNELLAVSSGQAEGILKTADQIQPSDRNIVLYTKVLAPELTKYFDNLSGIISEQGGVLSHLAIIAREKGLPVLVNYDNSIALGNKVKIDCTTATIETISSEPNS